MHACVCVCACERTCTYVSICAHACAVLEGKKGSELGEGLEGGTRPLERACVEPLWVETWAKGCSGGPREPERFANAE